METKTVADAGGFRRGMRVRESRRLEDWRTVIYVGDVVLTDDGRECRHKPAEYELHPNSVWEGQVRHSDTEFRAVAKHIDYESGTAIIFRTTDRALCELSIGSLLRGYPTIVWPKPKKPKTLRTVVWDSIIKNLVPGLSPAHFDRFIDDLIANGVTVKGQSDE